MISTTYIALIQYLKQHPKQGMADKYKKASDKTEAAINARIEELKTAAEDILSIVDDYAKVVDALDQENLSLGMGIGKLAKVFDDYETAIVDTIKAQTFLEQRNKSLNKSFGITSKTAAVLGSAYDNLNQTLGTGGENIRVYAQSVDKVLPGMSKMIALSGTASSKFKSGFNVQLLGTNQLLSEHIGLTGDAANKYQLYAAGAGKNSLQLLSATQEWAAAFDEASGMTGTFAGIVKDIADLSEDAQMTYSKMPGSLEKAVAKARILGTTFKEIEAMATKMLDIETSVGQELEYQLLSGKRLVNQEGESITEKLRIAKLSGNSEAQVKAMNDLLTTQGDILDGNNHYAKEQLSQLTGFTVDQLVRQRQTRKLMEQGGMNEAQITDMLSLDPAKFADALSKMEPDNAAILKSLKEKEGQKTTDELYADMLKRERTEGINVDIVKSAGKTQEGIITQARTETENAEAAVKAYIKPFMSETNAVVFGQLQSINAAAKAANAPLKTFSSMMPVVGSSVKSAIEATEKFMDTTTGELITTGKEGPGSGNVEAKPAADDAVLVNDAMIQFHPADKFATVSDGAALLASTERGKLDSAVNTLTGGNSNTAVVDPSPIAAAIMSALNNVKLEINYDVVKATEAGNFKFNQSVNG
jgi:hypothetical protein